MRVVYSDKFLKALAKLPKKIQVKLDSLVDLLAQDAFHPLLHSKQLGGNLIGAYSFRVTRDWRAIFIFDGKDVIKLINVGNRKDIYR
jgi:addiction module RelE/StbE family toxin